MPINRPELRKWQELAFKAWLAAEHRGIVSVVTGGGKTTFALHCLDSYRRSVPAATCVIVVPTAALLEQWLSELTDYFDIPLTQIVVLSKKSKIRQSRINIGVINSVASMDHTKTTDAVFLIVDECHRAASDEFQKIFGIPTDASLGLSATPDRQYDNRLGSVLIPHLGDVIFVYSYKDALADGVIVPFALRNIVFEFDADEQAQYDKLTRAISVAAMKFGLESPEAIAIMMRRTRLSNRSLARVQIAVKLVAKHIGRKIIVFHEDIDACDLIRGILVQNGVAAGVYHSRIPLPERVSTLRAYKNDTLKVLVTCRALDEGFNVPETEIGIVAASTATYRQRIQRLGRVLRPAKGKAEATVYSLVASVPEIRRLAEEAVDLDGVAEVTWTRA